MARQYGISFELTQESETELRQAGADDGLLSALRRLAPRESEGLAPGQAAPTVLIIEAAPGAAEVYIDDERMGRTSAESRLRISQVAPGEHRIRLSLGGYRDHDRRFRLEAGETVRMLVTLEAVKPAAWVAVAEPSVPLETPRPRVSTEAVPSAAKPEVANFQVAHHHLGSKDCQGLMTISKEINRYRSQDGTHSYDFPLNIISEARKNAVYLADIGGFRIRLKKGTNFNFIVVNSAGQYQPPDALLALEKAMGKN